MRHQSVCKNKKKKTNKKIVINAFNPLLIVWMEPYCFYDSSCVDSLSGWFWKNGSYPDFGQQPGAVDYDHVCIMYVFNSLVLSGR